MSVSWNTSLASSPASPSRPSQESSPAMVSLCLPSRKESPDPVVRR
jgi:hypothetical protein